MIIYLKNNEERKNKTRCKTFLQAFTRNFR